MSNYHFDRRSGLESATLSMGVSGRKAHSAVTADTEIVSQAAALRRRVEAARIAVQAAPTADAQRDYHQALRARQQFWRDTCREPNSGFAPSKMARRFYQEYGCRFFAPSCEQVQYIIDALDAALPDWDGRFPHLFYQTLELNFPDLLRDRRRAFFPAEVLAPC